MEEKFLKSSEAKAYAYSEIDHVEFPCKVHLKNGSVIFAAKEELSYYVAALEEEKFNSEKIAKEKQKA